MPPTCPPRVLLLALGFLMVAPLVAQSPPVDLRAVAARPDVWPREVQLNVPAAAGRTTLPAGQMLKVVGLEGSSIVLDHQGALVTVPLAQTNFLSLAGPELARRPSPARAALPAVAAPPPSAPPGAPPAPSASATQFPPVRNALGVQLDSLLVRREDKALARVPAGSLGLGAKRYLLLQFGGGSRWTQSFAETSAAMHRTRTAGVSIEMITIPFPGISSDDAVRLARYNAITWPMLDPRETSLTRQLWTQYAHGGTFALAIVDADGKVVIQTASRAGGSAGNFHSVLGELDRLPAPGRP